MCHNDKKNAKARHETLLIMNLKTEAWKTNIDNHVSLEKKLMEVKSNNDNVFLAAE